MTRLDARPWLAVTLGGGLAATCLSVAVHRSVYAAEAAGTCGGQAPAIDLAEKGAFPLPAHLESADIAAGKHDFEQLFKSGDALFHTAFNGLDGVGMAVLANGSKVNRFTVTPPGGAPARHARRSRAAAATARPSARPPGRRRRSIAFDNDQDGKGPFNVRSTTSVFGDGILQLLAQEITEDLHARA